jgi:hypothetical protein
MADRAVSAADYPRQSNLPISIARGQSFGGGHTGMALLNRSSRDGGWDIHRYGWR